MFQKEQIVSICAKIVFFFFLQNCRDVKNEVFEKFFFFVFAFFMLLQEKQKKKKLNGKGQKPYKNSVFKGCHPKRRKWKKWFLAKIAWHSLCQEGRKNAFSCTLSVLATKLFDQNSESQIDYKTSGLSGNCPKPKMTRFLGKRCFLTSVEKWAVLFWKHCFYSAFGKTQQLQ